MLPDLLCFTAYTDNDEREIMLIELISAVTKATDVMLEQVIPLLREYEALEPIDLWNSTSYAILFSIDVLLDIVKPSLRSIVQMRNLNISRRLSVSSRCSILERSSKVGHPNTSKRADIVEPHITATLTNVSDQQSDILVQLAAPEQAAVLEQSEVTDESSISNQTSDVSSFFGKVGDTFTVETLRQGSLFPKLTHGVARSLLRAGRCGSLAQRLDLTSSELYYLISLPTSSSSSPNGEGESECHSDDHAQCSTTSCSCFNVNEATYQPRHTGDCVMCDGLEVDESKLVDLIRRNEVPVIQSTMDRNGRVSIRVQKMTKHRDYIAISHVWAGGLGNFQRNQLAQCQLESIHRDVCRTMTRAFLDLFELEWGSAPEDAKSLFWPMRKFSSWLMGTFSSWLVGTTTCYYWMDTLCIPNNHAAERKDAINSMGRVYAGARAVLVLDPALSGIALHDEGPAGKYQDRAINMLVQASPWMARSWPLQEAALASGLYIKFADEYVRYDHELLGMAATLDAIPNQKGDSERLQWLPNTVWGIVDEDIEFFKTCNLIFKSITSYSIAEDDEEIVPGQSRSYTLGADFVKVWNLLSKRTTSYSSDVPAIFAALLYQSAGEILAVDPARRVWSILGSVDRLPADILCVELEESPRLPHPQQPRQWMPRLPGSSRPVMSLSLDFGSLQRVASGFILRMYHPSTLAVVCRKGVPMASGGHFLMRVGGQQSFSVHFREPTSHPNTNSTTTTTRVSKGKSISSSPPEEETGQESQLILLFRKRAPGSLLENCAVLCKINSESEDKGTLRVQFLSNTITWRVLSEREQQQPPDYETRDCVFIDASSSILIEMDSQHWPTLTWSRFNAYPYRHFLAQSFRFYDTFMIHSHITGLLAAVVIWATDFVVYFTGDSSSFIMGFLGPNIIHLVIIVLRIFVAVLYTVLLSVAQNRWARYFWSLSFWDVPRARKTLSGIPFYVPWYFLTFDAAVLAGAGALFQALWFLETPWMWFVRLIPLTFMLEYGMQLARHLFARMQWFLSTIEYRGPHAQRHLRERLVASTLRYVVSSLQQNVHRFLLLCLTGSLGGLGLWLAIRFYKDPLLLSRDNGDLVYFLYIVTLSCMTLFIIICIACAAIALWILFYILRDLVREAVRIYGRVWWARKGKEVQRIELV
ncbi:hypothetical protein F4679DRAFT_538541 [Xylaria curta]|nr:hypothetical protein F4679DRAFT_538541 [Xylaria curta]